MQNRDGPLSNQSEESALISVFWNHWRVTDEIGAANWEALEELERKTADCLAAEPPDSVRARHYTAQAMLLISGRTY